MSKAWEGGSTRAWRKLRLEILARDNWKCRIRIPEKCTGEATQVHHTLGRKVTGDDPAHLESACAPCNRAVGEPGKRTIRPEPRTTW